MIEKHKKRSNVAAGVWLVSLAAIIYMFSNGYIEGNIWDTGNMIAISVFVIQGVSFAAALWWYAKSKGYWGILGILLMFFSLIGLIILAVLPDKMKEAPENEV